MINDYEGLVWSLFRITEPSSSDSNLVSDQNQSPLGESENALPLQIVEAFVTDLVLRAFKHCGGFKVTLYDFVKTRREIALIPISGVIGRMSQALMAAAVSLELLEALPQEQI